MINVPAAWPSIVVLELRTRMRGWGSAALVTGYVALLGGVALAFLFQQATPVTAGSSHIGIILFRYVAVLQLLFIVFATPSCTAAAITGERQRKTWDLLLLTRVSTLGIVCGKLLGALAFIVLLISATLPIFCLAYLQGGVPKRYVAFVYIVFLATILLLGSATILISAIGKRVIGTLVMANTLALLLALGLTLLTAYLQNWAAQHATGQPAPPITPLAQIDPFVALASALPNARAEPYLGKIGLVHHPFFLPATLLWWEVYVILALCCSAVLVGLTAYIIRPRSRPWLRVFA